MEPGSHTEKIVHFEDQKADHKVSFDSLSDPTYGCSDTAVTSLDQFFARPIKIDARTWTVGNTVLVTINPWSLYFNNARVINRITNYRNLRCNLHVKVTLNGSGFHYGRLLMSYLPYANDDIVTPITRAQAQDAILESQRPHLYLDPTNSQGGIMDLPFFYHKNNLDVVSEDWDEMGSITFRSLQTLRHANGANDSITITTYAWITNVVLSGPTSTDSGALVAQSGEYSDSPVSTPAFAIQNIARSLTTIPFLTPFAMATEIAAGAIGNIAKLFGYSRPNIICPIEARKPVYAGDMVSSNTPDTCTKLAMDVKQELTVDPRTCGLSGVDESNITAIVQHESYLTQFSWNMANVADDLLFSCYVMPTLYDKNTVGGADEFHMTSLCYASHPFTYWRGTISFRFMIVASSYQKGRIRVVYDPWLKEGTEYNTNYQTIIDLADSRDFTIDVGWANSRSFLKVDRCESRLSLPFSTSAITDENSNFANGTLSVFVVNELTSPNTTAANNAAINVLVSGNDDFQVAVPHANALSIITDKIYEASSRAYVPQAGAADTHADSDETLEQSAPIQDQVTDRLAAAPLQLDNTWKVFLGDPVTSFRTLAKRYSHSIFHGVAGTHTTARTEYFIMPNFPIDPGYSANGLHDVTTPADPTPYNFTNYTLLKYVTAAYAGWRGGIRWKYVPNHTSLESNAIEVFQFPGYSQSPSVGSNAGGHQGSSYSQQAQYHQAIRAITPGGTHVVLNERNPVMEVEFPFYSYDRFIPHRTIATDVACDRTHKMMYSRRDTGVISGFAGFNGYCAAGEDYFPMFYIGPPIFYFETVPTASF